MIRISLSDLHQNLSAFLPSAAGCRLPLPSSLLTPSLGCCRPCDRRCCRSGQESLLYPVATCFSLMIQAVDPVDRLMAAIAGLGH
jgi:hypothetical protein